MWAIDRNRTGSTASHFGFSDESRFNTGAVGAVALVSGRKDHIMDLGARIDLIRKKANVEEVKWEKVRTDKYAALATDLMTEAILMAADGRVRVDVLSWDKSDSRNAVKNRDDVGNLGRFYYHLCKKTLSRDWPNGATWSLYPDKQNEMDWNTTEDTLYFSGKKPAEGSEDLSIRAWQKVEYKLMAVTPVDSTVSQIQVADLFAGAATYSRENFQKQRSWRDQEQTTLLPQTTNMTLSSADRYRCKVIDQLCTACQRKGIKVRLYETNGLRSLSGEEPIDFWWYKPQHDKDKAPTKSGRGIHGNVTREDL